ncbi:MAG: PP2C family protein-serine/threonine phosphatase [Terracidiphilus sp.]
MKALAKPKQLAISFAEKCDRGIVREENQDSVLRTTTPLGELLIVADGLGGYQGGAVASRIAVDSISAYFAGLPADYLPAMAIRESIIRANAEILNAASSPGSIYTHMGSTVVMALLQPIGGNRERGPAAPNAVVNAVLKAWIGHVGDSRAYHVRDRRLYRITRDHSAVQAMLDRNLITPEQALNHPDASVLTRSLGHEPEVDADIDSVQLEPGDSLLLCSDGLWGYVDERAIEAVAANSALDVETASAALLELALTAGGYDNVGIEIARVANGPGKTPASPSASAFRSTRIFGKLRLIEILAVALLAFAAIGALACFAYLEHWFHLSSKTPQSTPAPSQTVPASPQAPTAGPKNGPAAAHSAPAPTQNDGSGNQPQGGAVAAPASGPVLTPQSGTAAKPQNGHAAAQPGNPTPAPNNYTPVKPQQRPAAPPPTPDDED